MIMVRRGRCGRSNEGFTLIEILVSMVLTGILVAGMVGLWNMVADQFFRLSLRQKAVFVLHGHMERLARLYRLGRIADMQGVTNTSTGYTRASPLSTSTVHSLFVTGTAETSLLVKTAAAAKSDFPEGTVFYLGNVAVPAAIDRNVVWLDRDKDVSAQLSWTLDAPDPSPDPSNLCMLDASGKGCQSLTLYLDYPYRFTPGTPPTHEELPGYAVETVSVKTIVGRRQ